MVPQAVDGVDEPVLALDAAGDVAALEIGKEMRACDVARCVVHSGRQASSYDAVRVVSARHQQTDVKEERESEERLVAHDTILAKCQQNAFLCQSDPISSPSPDLSLGARHTRRVLGAEHATRVEPQGHITSRPDRYDPAVAVTHTAQHSLDCLVRRNAEGLDEHCHPCRRRPLDEHLAVAGA